MNWPKVSLGSICGLRNGRAFKPEEWSDAGTPIVRIQNLNDESKPFNYCAFEVESKFLVNSGDLLFSWSGTPGTSFGAFFWNRGRGFLNQHIFRVDVDEVVVERPYLRYALNSLLVEIIDQSHGGVGLKHITKGKLEEIQVPLPPLPEQRRIAAILDKADALRAKRRVAIAKLDQLLQSVFLDMFGDPVTNPKAEVMPLSSLCDRITDGTHQSPTWADDGVPFLFQSNVKPGEISYDTKRCISLQDYSALTARCPIEFGDVLYTIVGSYGNAAMVRTHEPFCFQRHIAHLKPTTDVLPDFLEAMLNQPAVKRQADERAAGVAQRTLILKELRQLRVLKPDMAQQRRFQEHSASIATIKQRAVKHVESANRFFESLQKNAFSGAL